MVKCKCINDKKKPSKIPANKWVKEGEEYTIIFTVVVLPQKKLAVQLAEIDFDESCAPFEYFMADRFAFTKDELDKLAKLIKDCNDTDFSMDELMNQTKINDRAADTN